MPTIALADSPIWTNRVESLLHEYQFETVQHAASVDLIEHLIEEYPAMLIADGDRADWLSWITLIKTDQATRRIPVLAIAQDQPRLDTALAAGADSGLTLDDLDRTLISQVYAYSRQLDPAILKELECQCQDDLPPLARLGVERFNAGAYYAQHDAFEEQWLKEPGPVRNLYRAVLQVGVAYYHLTRGNYVGGLRMLNRSIQWFWMLPDVCQGIDVRQLREDAHRVRAVLKTTDPATLSDFDMSLLKALKLADK